MIHTKSFFDFSPTFSKGHVLLISPPFFDYYLSISSVLNKFGYKVTWWDERPYTNIFYKLALRIFPSVVKKYFDHIYLNRLLDIKYQDISHVLIIKGEGISRRVALEMRKKMAYASFGLYFWDSFENVSSVSSILDLFDSISTFDPQDSKNFNWHYRPLFSHNSLTLKKKKNDLNRYDWCFIGSMHSDRHRVIHRLRKNLGKNTQSFVFCYFQSPLILMYRKMIDWTLWFAPPGTLSTQSMSAADLQYYVNLSDAVLDIEHPKQRGLTMRTIETMISEKKLITTNKNVIDSNLYDKSRIHIINRDNPQLPSNFIDCPFLPIPKSLKDYYSCETWVSELLDLQDLNKKKSSSLSFMENIN
jgi:hypothetical protein